MRWIIWVGLGILFPATFLDAISNALSLVSPFITYITTGLIIIVLLFANRVLKKWPLIWVIDNQSIRIKSIRTKPKALLLGVLALVWVPRVVDVYKVVNYEEPRTAIQIFIPNMQFDYGENYDLVHIVPAKLDFFSYYRSAIPIVLQNTTDKTIDNIIVSIRYWNNTIGYVDTPKKKVLGGREIDELSRRVEVFEDVITTYIKVDSLNPGQTVMLNEPINLLNSAILDSSISSDIVVSITGRDIGSYNLGLKLRCVQGSSKKDAIEKYKAVLFKEIVEKRKASSFLSYLQESLASHEKKSILIYTLPKRTMNPQGEFGYTSYALKNESFHLKYNPAPLAYLF